jgi:hypothetical protein
MSVITTTRPDRHASTRILARLRLGTAPREGVRFLSVGLDAEAARLAEGFAALAEGASQLIRVTETYGEGKSQLLDLAGELARAAGCATAHLVHDPRAEASLHRPSQLLRHLLEALAWEQPALDLGRFSAERYASYSYGRDRAMRALLPMRLAEIAAHCRGQGYAGLVFVLDELDSYELLHARSRPIAQATFEGLGLALAHVRHVGVVTAAASETALAAPVTIRLAPQPLTPALAAPLLDRLVALHTAAHGWEPALPRRIDAAALYEQLARAAPASRWRAFVQRVVYLLDVEHQEGGSKMAGSAIRTKSEPHNPPQAAEPVPALAI